MVKRFRRAVAIFLSLVLFASATAAVGAVQEDAHLPDSVQSFAQMCD